MIKLKRKELSDKYNISYKTWQRRHDDILKYLSEYMDIQEVCEDHKHTYYVINGELPEEIPPLPRKSQMEEKQKVYDDYTYWALGKDFKPNSKSRIAREAIWDFGEEKYGHKSVRAVVNRYVSKSFDKYGESDGVEVWVNYDNYKLLSPAEKDGWLRILREEKIDEKSAANAFYRLSQGEDISEELNYYQKAQKRMMMEFGVLPIRVKSWRRKED